MPNIYTKQDFLNGVGVREWDENYSEFLIQKFFSTKPEPVLELVPIEFKNTSV